MSLSVLTKVENQTVVVTVTGAYSIEEMLKLVDIVKAECETNEIYLALVDCSEMTGTMTEAERFAGGQRVAEVLGSDIKAVLVMPKGQVTKLGELTAINRGARFLVTDDHGEAMDWLHSDQ